MRRYVLVITALSITLLAAAVTVYSTPSGSEPDTMPEDMPGQDTDGIPAYITAEPDIIMPTKSSRPGCEEDGLCYIPETISVHVGQTITWENADAAFHSVTSGTYEEPDGLFDSGYMDPEDLFSHTFDKPGTYSYHCTLHPWMYGTILVQ